MEELNRILIPYKDVVFAINLTKIAGKFYIECYENRNDTNQNICIIGEIYDELDIVAQAATGLSITAHELERWYGLIHAI